MTERKSTPADGLPDHLPRWLEAMDKRVSAELAIRVRDRFPELRGSHRRILQMIPTQGIRITDLALMAGMTKQSLGEFVDRLEEASFVRSSRDPGDGRVRLVSRTRLGDEASESTAKAIAAMESALRAEIGPVNYDAMMRALRALGRE